MAARDIRCLQSTVKNISGQTMPFSFLPPHGKRLDDDEEYTVDGDIVSLITCRFEQATAKRYVDAFFNALEQGYLEIVKTPAPILADDVVGQPSKMLFMEAGDLYLADPCFDDTNVSVSVDDD